MGTLRETKRSPWWMPAGSSPGCPGRLKARPTTVAVTRRGKPVLAIMTWEDYEAILETLEVLSDEEAMDKLRQSIREVKEDKAVPWKEARARLDV